MNSFRTLIVPAAQVGLARSIAAAFGPGGQGMFTTPLSDVGLAPASHYISSGFVPSEFAYIVPLQVWIQDETGVWIMVASEPGDPATVYEEASAAGVSCTQAEVTALFASSDVTAQEPFVAMERLGISIVNPPAEA